MTKKKEKKGFLEISVMLKTMGFPPFFFFFFLRRASIDVATNYCNQQDEYPLGGNYKKGEGGRMGLLGRTSPGFGEGGRRCKCGNRCTAFTFSSYFFFTLHVSIKWGGNERLKLGYTPLDAQSLAVVQPLDMYQIGAARRSRHPIATDL